ncbi:hypothetical protein DSL72_000533 [Monilinia vaccinii-corymbosi]|uniref:Uncharacterized protein n=1 Tax=Monilinia vaccinii-corymbosi TaxID=61207 RepID=A0A8A3NZL1_9HELO|nr:hypothetical protein DSL72_000533 [Monilinia vaccinii-corymbosi]
MSKAYISHFTFDSKVPGRPPRGSDIGDYIPVQPGREKGENEDEEEEIPAFDVLQWLSIFYGQKVPPLPVINHATDIDELPDQRLQQTMEEYEITGPTVKKQRLKPFTEIGVAGFPLIEKTKFNIVRSYPADEQHYYHGRQSPIWTISNSYYRAVAWCVYGNWELWPHVKAQHRIYVNRALENKAGPRHAVYKELNRARKGHNNLNLTERLGIPYCAIRHEDIQQVTADLYGIFLVVFTYQPEGRAVKREGVEPDQAEQHYAPTLRGDFNRPHKFIRLSIGTLPEPMKTSPESERISTWQIYEPMMPNWAAPARAADFKYVRPSFENTRASLPPDMEEAEGGGYGHPWRRIFGHRVGLPWPLTHPPRWPRGIPICQKDDVDTALGCTHDTNPDDLATTIPRA